MAGILSLFIYNVYKSDAGITELTVLGKNRAP